MSGDRIVVKQAVIHLFSRIYTVSLKVMRMEMPGHHKMFKK